MATSPTATANYGPEISVWDSQTIDSNSIEFKQQLDNLGVLSGVAQELNGPITSVEKLISSDHTLITFIEMKSKNPIGYIKFGPKNLYFYTNEGKIINTQQCPCVLDFYVEDSLQRKGVGLQLFQAMLQHTQIRNALRFAYDRPSFKLLGFLEKHFNLRNPDHQPNRFCIYNGFLPLK
eukprot:gene9426-12702_t